MAKNARKLLRAYSTPELDAQVYVTPRYWGKVRQNIVLSIRYSFNAVIAVAVPLA